MNLLVFTPGDNKKIAHRIILVVSINVVDKLFRRQIPAKFMLDHHSVHGLASIGQTFFALPIQADKRPIAFLTAKIEL